MRGGGKVWEFSVELRTGGCVYPIIFAPVQKFHVHTFFDGIRSRDNKWVWI